jgi:hypothetical protein
MKLQLLREQYAHALRAIGQDLSDLFPECLEIEMTGENFVARGLSRPGIPASKNNDEWRAVRTIREKSSQPSPEAQASRSPFVRTYTPDAINKLDAKGRARRATSAQRPDLDSLAERLRMIGRIVDEKNAELVKLCHDTNSVTFQYRDRQGEIHSEEYSTLTLHKLQQQYDSGRCFRPQDPSRATGR